uniref:Photosystem I reaction center subunit PsaK 1 n=1 Tax=Cyanophora paradoxa TaxID=2762 RepID=UPI001EF1616B|nr:Chain K, Photosystem I reaction center subunit PsaK 1 [Cyanophora paradoxa]7DR2_aK Chain aK, Photosystem I reaction center subunit PsaK 1 [Cyanophora paradoxa]7DR2_cK Chain cK, Photosystem I reaction center subunit PsaK 1 [Cyanophora paradoxa]
MAFVAPAPLAPARKFDAAQARNVCIRGAAVRPAAKPAAQPAVSFEVEAADKKAKFVAAASVASAIFLAHTGAAHAAEMVPVIAGAMTQSVGEAAEKSFVMLASVLFAGAVGGPGIKMKGQGPAWPFNAQIPFTPSEFLAVTALGHIIGTGVILGIGL